MTFDTRRHVAMTPYLVQTQPGETRKQIHMSYSCHKQDMSVNAISRSTSCYIGSCGGLSTRQLSHTCAGIPSYEEICDHLKIKCVNIKYILKYFQQCFVIFLLLLFSDIHITNILHSLSSQ